MWNNNRTNFDRNLAVVIGIDRYDSRGIHDLQTAVRDAIAIANLLRDEYGYKDEHIVRLFSPKNDEATLKSLNQPYRPATLKELRILLTDTLPNYLKPTQADRLVFYFAGHGIPRNSKDGPAGYLVPQTAEQGNPESFLSMRELHDALSKLECHHLLVILDCCFAGTFRWASSRKAIPILETVHKEHYDRFIRYPAWQVLTSAAHDQEALDLSIDQRGSAIKDTRHSPFALALIEGLRDNKADVIQDKVITAHELYLYLDGRVNELSREMQTPGIYPMRLDYDRGEYIFTRPGFKRDDLTEAPPLNEENNPYRGLKPFEERHSRFFFGRKALVEELSDRLVNSHRPLTVVLGPSGSGKPSLVKAGLLPHLREKHKKDEQTQRWYILNPMRPGKSPFTELAKAVLPVANSNLIAQLAQLSFLDRTFVEILDPKFEQKQKAASLDSTQSDSREQPSGDEAFDATKLAERWNHAEPEAKLLLLVDYFAQLQGFCHQPQEQEKLSNLYRAIEQTLNPLTQTLQQDPQFFTHLMAKWNQNNPNTKLLLVIDQFEELITMSQDDRGSGKQSNSQEQDDQKEWQRFLSLLRITLAKHRRQLHVVLTLRSDFEPRFLNSALKAHWRSARFPVRAMNSDELRDAIEGPALKQALYFEPPKLVGKLIDEVGQMPGALPLLSFTLSELYIKLAQRWREDPNSTDRALRIKDYEELGGVAGALTRRATQEYDNLVSDFGETSGKAYQATMQRVMLRMLTLEGGEVARRRVPESELVYPNDEENKRVALVSDRLLKARLLVKGQETGEPYIEPAHDFLVQGWNQLRDWLKEENNPLQRRLTPAALEWKAQQNARFLWHANPYLEVLKKEARKSLGNNWLNQIEAEFVKRSLWQKRQNIGLRWSSVSLAFVLLSIVTLKAIENSINAQIQSLLSSSNLAEFLFISGRELESLKEALKAGKQLHKMENTFFVKNFFLREDTKIQVLATLEHIVDGLRERNHWEGHKMPILSVSFSPDGQILASASRDGTITLWKRDGTYIQTLYHADDSGAVFRVIFTRDSQLLISVSQEQGIKIWQHQPDGSFILRQPIPDKDPMSAISLSPDNQTIVTASSNEQKTIKFWSLNGKLLNNLPSMHEDVINDLSFSPDGKNIASASADRTIKLWSVKNQKLLKTISDSEQLYSLLFVNDRTIASGSGDGKINLWDVVSGQKTSIKFQEQHSNKVLRLALSSDGRTIASASADRTVKLWDLKDGKLLDTLSGYDSDVEAINFSPDGKIASASDRTIRIWNRERLAPATIEGASFNFSSDNKTIVTAKDTTIYLWQRDGKPITFFPSGHKDDITQVRFSPDSQTIASASADGTVKLWNLDGTSLGTLQKHEKPVTSVSFSPNGKIIATASLDKTIKLWERDRRLKATFNTGSEVASISFSPDSERIASANDDSTIKLWTLKGQLDKRFQRHTKAVLDVSFSPNGKTIASASVDETVRLWNLEDKTSKEILPRQTQVNRVTFSPTGQILASGGKDKTIKLWSLNGKLLQELRGHNTAVNDISFSPDNNILASVDNDGQVILRNLNLDILLERGCNYINDYLASSQLNSKENPCTGSAPSPF